MVEQHSELRPRHPRLDDTKNEMLELAAWQAKRVEELAKPINLAQAELGAHAQRSDDLSDVLLALNERGSLSERLGD